MVSRKSAIRVLRYGLFLRISAYASASVSEVTDACDLLRSISSDIWSFLSFDRRSVVSSNNPCCRASRMASDSTVAMMDAWF